MPVSTPYAVRAEDPTRRREPAPAVRTDIQGLRALAVSLVLLFHLWPNRLTGGFVGVDVFFVISGFLISSHLLAHPPTRARDLLVFWARRIQRLLPASLLVLAVTVVGTRLFAPETLWGSTAEQIRAAALYVVNWELATTSVDYLAAEAAPSPAQHYWSLSIEEQFYLGWPVALLLLFLLARLLRRSAYLVVVPGIVAVVAASLTYSVTATAAEPAAAYFVTPTRIWELGIGGLLAALLSKRAFGRDVDHEHLPISVGARIVLAWVGFAAIAWTAVTYSGAAARPRHRGGHRRRLPDGAGLGRPAAGLAAGAVPRRHLLLGLPVALAAGGARPLRHRAPARPLGQAVDHRSDGGAGGADQGAGRGPLP